MLRYCNNSKKFQKNIEIQNVANNNVTLKTSYALGTKVKEYDNIIIVTIIRSILFRVLCSRCP